MKLKVGMVAAVDMLALSIAVERGFLKKYGVDVTIARPYATGVVALNALQAGETDIVQASGPAIGAILRGMDLVFLGNVSGNATKAGPMLAPRVRYRPEQNCRDQAGAGHARGELFSRNSGPSSRLAFHEQTSLKALNTVVDEAIDIIFRS